MSSPDPARRLLLGAAAVSVPALALAPVLGGCGFQLRQPPSFSFRHIVLAGFANRSPMEKALRDELARTVEVLSDPAKADVVLTALDDVNTRVVAASTAAGQVRELRLTLRLRFNLSRPSGVMLLEPTEIEQVRDLSYSETFALAKEQEEAELVRDMRADIVSQVLRALAAPDVSSGS